MRGFDHFLNIILEIEIKSNVKQSSEILVHKIKIR